MTDFKKLLPFAEKLGKEGLLLTSGKKPNTMVISWGSVGVYWGETVFTAPVRVSRYTREKIDESGVFSICVPSDEMKSALKIFGSKSGRVTDKYDETGLSIQKCKQIDTYAITGSPLTIECQVVGETELDPDSVDPAIQEKWYADNDYHIMYYGKIVDLY